MSSAEQAIPRTLAELKDWLRARGTDPKIFAVDWEPEQNGYFIVQGPRCWWIYTKGWCDDEPQEEFILRCDTEAQLCECYVELVSGTDDDEGSLTTRIVREQEDRIKRSWQVDQTEEQEQ